MHTEKHKFETICNVALGYIRAYLQNPATDLENADANAAQIDACLELARKTVRVFESAFEQECAIGETDNPDGRVH